MNLPNKLTVFRILIIPLFIGIVVFPVNGANYMIAGSSISLQLFLAAFLFSIASITDWLDGKIARKQGIVTNFGKFADPLADKMLVMTAFILLVELELAPAWVVALIVCRELAVTGLRLLLVEQGGMVLAAAWPGKIKTATQMLAIVLLFLNNFPFNAIGIPMAQILLYICLFFTLYSGIDYFYKNRKVFADSF
ncbi:CDP-diacylglycerol--glycerol-3-phosphate 3-phosphatidyltransferase [Lacticigenium naphthae]|uniref:CDP-diacylglycerol--glycerol-3-phosphate 3-phosphatidyltransferase n=1 Tax=Lacticigenium naphthae TaxID=515351 RepID=UPI00040246C8|nr:CDP-diacylglycerol--glycerol-3-phosphate 3-phosphatidyltransferase [Lacticigenium naphthae]